MYKCKHFKIHELVPKHVYKERGERAWLCFDDRALQTLDSLRDEFGSATVNNWYWGGPRQWSGLRTSESPYGTQYSQHRYGRAFDVLFRHKTAQEVREHIMSNQEDFPHIRGIEDGPAISWLHFDTGNRPGTEGIYVFNV